MIVALAAQCDATLSRFRSLSPSHIGAAKANYGQSGRGLALPGPRPLDGSNVVAAARSRRIRSFEAALETAMTKRTACRPR
ncbi:protein of unknown function [Methylocella tundrae]|uniref:Uncharacterized protein n=1 Tax=Methylocella tundrae TaxID=227605 RepID=A0A4U8Z3V9_METTU|nr:protein of unknown function [Methylocella tundrae]